MIRVLGRLAFYAVAAVIATWPIAVHPRALLASVGGPGDALLNLWILGWDLATIHAHPGRLLDGRIFDANIFYPAERTLAYSDHLIPQALAMWPVYAVARDPVLCYNLLFLASLVASGLAMDAFVRAVTGARWGALFAGLAWTIGPFHVAHIVHLQLQGLYVLPIVFLALHRFMARRATRDAIALGGALALEAWSSVYYGVIGGIGAAAAAVALTIAVGRARDLCVPTRLAVAAVVAAVLVSPVAWVYLRVQRQEGFGRSLFEAANSTARIDSYLRAPSLNVLYGDRGIVPLTRPTQETNPSGPERQLFPGTLIVVLAIVGAASAHRSDQRPIAVAMAVVAIVGFVCSLGPDGVGPVYALLHRFVLGFQAIRAPGRFGILTHFALAVLAAIGLEAVLRLVRTSRARRVAAVLLVAIGIVEWINYGDAYMSAPPRRTAVGQWLRTAEEPGAVVFLPLARDVQNTPVMVQSLEHLRPIVNGYSGQVPPFYGAIIDALATFPGSEALWTLRDLDVRFVVAPALIATAPPLVERARLDGTVIYELRWTPETEATLTPPLVAPVPPPGQLPFDDAEEVTYSVYWTSGIGHAEAGEAVVTAERHAEGFTFALSARTAPWIARFFEADDRFETRASPALLPLRHSRRIREGRRALDRTFEYDSARHRVSFDDLSLPLVPASRDPLSAFFYLRTLRWSSLESIRVPINDAGRNLVLAVRRIGEEAVEYSARRENALRLDCTIEQRIQRRQPINFTVWLSTDSRRLPLAASIEAGFGRVRAELTER